VASDSLLLGELLNGVSTLGGTAKHHVTGKEEKTLAASVHPHPEHLKQSLVWSPGQLPLEDVIARAGEVYTGFCGPGGDKALICLGSIKSNPVVEFVLAEAFGCEPFQSHDDVEQPSERTCPIFLRYRHDDPHPTACSAGLKLSRANESTAPGIYYEAKDGRWKHCSWDQPHHDTALVFYIHRESQGRLEMVLGGFSGRATRLLAKTLSSRAEDFWPPVYSRHGIQVGAFIVQYTLSPEEEAVRDVLRTDLIAETQIIPLSHEAIARRLDAVKTTA
jgi:hypothetical protein